MAVLRLYDFQREAVERILASILEQKDNIIVSSPTGTGKSLIEIAVMQELDAVGKASALITSQNEIVRGIGIKARKYGLGLRGRLWTPQKFWNRIQAKRAKRPEVVLIDECHHALAPTWERFVTGGLTVAGLTATPFRGLETEFPAWMSLFHQHHEAITIVEAMRAGYLVPFYMLKDTMGLLALANDDYSSDRKRDEAAATVIDQRMNDIYDVVASLDPTRPTVFITPTVGAAHSVAKYYQWRGGNVRVLIGTTPGDEREEILDGLSSGTCWASAVNLMTEGVDVQEIARIVNLRPSTSAIPYIQGIGRGLRPIYVNDQADFSLKRDCEYVDFTTNFQRFKSTLNTMGIRMVDGKHVLYPDLEFVEAPENRGFDTSYLATSGSAPGQSGASLRGMTFRFAPAQVKRVRAKVGGKILEADVGSTPANQWALRVFDAGKSDIFVLTGGSWVRKYTSIRPANYQVVVSGDVGLTGGLGRTIGGPYIYDSMDAFTLADLLFLSHIRLFYGAQASKTEVESSGGTAAQRFLTNVPPPEVVEDRALT